MKSTLVSTAGLRSRFIFWFIYTENCKTLRKLKETIRSTASSVEADEDFEMVTIIG